MKEVDFVLALGAGALAGGGIAYAISPVSAAKTVTLALSPTQVQEGTAVTATYTFKDSAGATVTVPIGYWKVEDTAGVEIASDTISNASTGTFMIDTNGLQNGTYVVTISDNSNYS